MFELLDIVWASDTCTFKLAKWVFQEFYKVIKIKGLKENMANQLKTSSSDLLIEQLVDLEYSFTDFKTECENRLAEME